MKMPGTLGGCIDSLYMLRTKRLAVQRQVDALKANEHELTTRILQLLADAEMDGAKGKRATCSVTKLITAQVDDWEKLYKYISQEGAYDLLQRRVNDAAYRARLDDGIFVPGTQSFPVEKLSLNKVSKKK